MKIHQSSLEMRIAGSMKHKLKPKQSGSREGIHVQNVTELSLLFDNDKRFNILNLGYCQIESYLKIDSDDIVYF